MKIAVIGATGGTGKQFVAEALKKGHQVTALVRNPEKLALQHPNLEILIGEALVMEDVRRAVMGKDAVLCALGSTTSSTKTTTRYDGTALIIKALAELREKPHLVIVSSLGAGDSRAQMSFVIRLFIGYILRHPLADHNQQETIVKQSALPWTILRPTALNDADAIGDVMVTKPPQTMKPQPPVTRADVALFALKVIENRSYVGEAVTLTSATSSTRP